MRQIKWQISTVDFDFMCLLRFYIFVAKVFVDLRFFNISYSCGFFTDIYLIVHLQPVNDTRTVDVTVATRLSGWHASRVVRQVFGVSPVLRKPATLQQKRNVSKWYIAIESYCPFANIYITSTYLLNQYLPFNVWLVIRTTWWVKKSIGVYVFATWAYTYGMLQIVKWLLSA